MNLSAKLATMFLIVVALGTIGTTAIAFAQSEEEILEQRESNTDVTVQSTEEEGVEEEEGENDVEEEGEEVSEEDVLFHQGLCAVGISTEALDELGGCEVLPPFGEDE